MRFNLSEEQLALADATSGLLGAYEHAHRQAALDERTELDAAAWRRAADELGLPGVAVAEEHGGAGGSLLDAAVVLEVAGRTLSPLPLWTSVGAARILEKLGDPTACGEHLSEVAAGTTMTGWVGLQPNQAISATEGTSRDPVLNGRAAHVVAGLWMDHFLVLANTDSETRLYLVKTGQDGLSVTSERSLDLTRHLTAVTFDNAPAVELSAGAVGPSSLDGLRAEIGVLLAAEQVGTAQGALDMAVDYAKSREQFGQPIGSFQSLKHLLADAYVDVATARDTTRFGAWALSGDPEDALQIAHLTRAVVTPRAVRVCAANIQVHGGIGYTWEHGAHLYYKRALSTAHLLGEVDHDLDSIADHIGLGYDAPDVSAEHAASARTGS